MAGLLQAAALPPRQPDHQHPARQGRAERGGAGLRRAGQARRRARVPRRRRRPGRRLRRLADQLRVERELHAAGVRQRRRLPHPERLRRGRRAAPDDRLRERPRGRRLPQRAGVQRAGRVRASARTTSRPSSPDDVEQPLVDLLETYQQPHGAQRARELPRRAAGARHGDEPVQPAATCRSSSAAMAENLFWAICHKIRKLVAAAGRTCPRSSQGLDALLSDTYFCNFSLFQSMPDSWAIKQLFPIMPIHRLDEQPTRHAVLGDITCDSDGKIDQFIDRRDVKTTLPLHTVQRRAVLPRRVPGRRLPGDPRRPAQPVRRHQRRARQPRRRRRGRRSTRSSRATRSARCSTTSSSTPTTLRRQAARPTSKPPCARAASTTKRPAACCGSTKTDSTGTPGKGEIRRLERRRQNQVEVREGGRLNRPRAPGPSAFRFFLPILPFCLVHSFTRLPSAFLRSSSS